jgi:uncharacterized cupin superfamily protein
MAEIIIKKPTKEELDKLKVFEWNTWEKEVSEFNWYYSTKEIAYILEGEVEVTLDSKVYKFGKGDLVEFPKETSTTWKVLKPVKKHFWFE